MQIYVADAWCLLMDSMRETAKGMVLCWESEGQSIMVSYYWGFSVCLFACLRACWASGGSGGPFRIPDEYITTREVRRKPVNKRLAFEVRLQRSHEAPRASQGEFDLGERDRSTADSLLFSAAQRRQERRLKELTRKTNRRKLTSKEMTWNVAYRKWSRWARAHPNLARFEGFAHFQS